MTAEYSAVTKVSSGPRIKVRGLTIGYGDFIVQRDLDFTIDPGDVFIIMGGSGSGKSTLLRHMVGLQAPVKGDVYFGDTGYWKAFPDVQEKIKRRIGIMFQGGALWSSLTLAENVALPLEEYTGLNKADIEAVVAFKLALVGLSGFEDFYPSQLSGGMRKRAGLARAMALDPEFLFLDEPSAGLDPVNSRRLDDLILEIRQNLGTTFVVVSHELASIFAIGTNSVFLDGETRTMLATGHPEKLRDACDNPKVRSFLTRSAE